MITEERRQTLDLSIKMADEKWKKLTIEERKKWKKHANIILKSQEFRAVEMKYKQAVTDIEKKEYQNDVYRFMQFIYLYFEHSWDTIFDK